MYRKVQDILYFEGLSDHKKCETQGRDGINGRLEVGGGSLTDGRPGPHPALVESPQLVLVSGAQSLPLAHQLGVYKDGGSDTLITSLSLSPAGRRGSMVGLLLLEKASAP